MQWAGLYLFKVFPSTEILKNKLRYSAASNSDLHCLFIMVQNWEQGYKRVRGLSCEPNNQLNALFCTTLETEGEVVHVKLV